MIFETDRLIVRTLTPEDADVYFQLHGDPEIMKYIRPAKSRQECEQLLREHIEWNQSLFPFGRWLAEDKLTHEVIGSFVIIPINDSPHMQLGYSLLKKNWGKGYASELTAAGLIYAFTKTPLEVIYAIAEDANVASQKVLTKAGFRTDYLFQEAGKPLTRFIFKRG